MDELKFTLEQISQMEELKKFRDIGGTFKHCGLDFVVKAHYKSTREYFLDKVYTNTYPALVCDYLTITGLTEYIFPYSGLLMLKNQNKEIFFVDGNGKLVNRPPFPPSRTIKEGFFTK